jgi:hypothetical protein
MSTEINIKKRIDIQEEGVSITPDVSSINFTGAGVTASTVGDNVTVNVIGSIGATAYYLNETVTQAPYKEFSSIPTAAAEQTIATVIGVGATATIQSFQTPSGVPNTTNIPAGLWQFYLHFSGTAGDSWDVYAEVYKRDLGGIETLLLTTDTIPTTVLSAIPTMILTDGVFPASTVLTTDRIVVKVLATNTGVAGQTITFHTEGSTNYSVGTTTLNQVLPTGAVSAVTGTAPVVSSGGTTPAISMPQANGSTDGYLSSADWTTFNNKRGSGVFGIANTSGVYTFYATLTLAMAAATAGQTIEMFADVTETGAVTIAWKNGVNFNGNGHTYTHSYAAGDSNTINLPTAVTANISNWRVIRTGRANGTSTDYVFTVTDTGFGNNASTIIFNNVYMESTYGNSVFISMGAGLYQGSLYGKGYLFGVYTYSQCRDLTGESTTSSAGIYAINNPTLYRCRGISVSGTGVNLVAATGVNCIGTSTSGTGIAGNPLYDCIGISVSGAGGGGLAYNSTFISTSGIGGDGLSGSNNTLISSSSNGADGFFGFTLENSKILSTSSYAARTRNSTLRNCVVTSNWNNAGGHAVSEWLTGGTRVLNCCLQVANASANCLNSGAGAISMSYASNVYQGSTTPVGANITQAIVNTQDNQGNILL